MTPAWDAIKWWEVRRIPYNLALLAAGLVTLGVAYGLAQAEAAAHQPVIFPPLLFLMIAAYAIAANVFYTLGWISELLWSGGDPTPTKPRRRRVFLLGLFASVALTLAPSGLFLLAWLVLPFRG